MKKANKTNSKKAEAAPAPAPEFHLEKMTAKVVELNGGGTITSNVRKGDVTVNGWTTHLIPEMENLKVGKAVHFGGQSGRRVIALFRQNGFVVQWVDTNVWKIVDVEGTRQYTMLNWSAGKAARAGREHYERSVRRVKFDYEAA